MCSWTVDYASHHVHLSHCCQHSSNQSAHRCVQVSPWTMSTEFNLRNLQCHGYHLSLLLQYALFKTFVSLFSNTFVQINAISTQVWKFLRYNLVIEYESKPILPPPLIFICHIYLLIKSCIRRCRGKREYLDNGLSK